MTPQAALGVYPGAGIYSVSGYQTWSDWLGRQVQVVDANMGINDWGEATSSIWGLFQGDDRFRSVFTENPGLTPAVTVGLCVRNDRDLDAVARGERDQWFRTVLERIGSYTSTPIIRLGHEPGVGYPWGLQYQTSAQYVAAFRHVAAMVRTMLPDALIDYQGNGPWHYDRHGYGAPTGDTLWPGDDVVDVTGVDTYWRTTQTVTSTRDRVLYALDLAARYDKLFSIPEWGLWVDGDQGRGDDPSWIDLMFNLMVQAGDRLLYHAYFDGIGACRLSQFPNSRHRFRELFATVDTPPPPPPPPPPSPPSPSVDVVHYVIRPGDTLWKIAAAHGCTLDDLRALNRRITDVDLVYPGELLHVPKGAQ